LLTDSPVTSARIPDLLQEAVKEEAAPEIWGGLFFYELNQVNRFNLMF
jgi:hypothetical protein